MDALPFWFWLPAAVVASVVYLTFEFRASARYWAARDAQDPVVVTGSGLRRDPRPYACTSVEVR